MCSSSQPSMPSSTTSTADLPDWAKPYAKDTLAKTTALTDINQNPYQQYGGDRIAGFSPMQQQAQNNAANMGVSPQLYSATNMAANAGIGAMNTNYQTGQFGNQFQAPGSYQPGQFSMMQTQAPDLQNYQMQGPGNVYSPTTSAAQLGAAPQADAAQFNGPGAVGYDRVAGSNINAPSLQNLQMNAAGNVAAQQVNTPMMGAAQTGYDPQLQSYQMGPAQQVRSKNFTQPGAADAYMNPYVGSVIANQQRDAQRQADIAGTQRGARAAQAGAFGGSRQAIENSEAARNLALQKGDIEATGMQNAYSQAQQQFNADQARQLAAQQSNQQAGLQTGTQNLGAALGVQQLGAQTGLQTSLANLSSAQQANVQNQAAQLQTQGMNSQQALQAALANQGVQQQANMQNLSAGLQTQGLGAQTSLAAQQSNQANALQAGLANQQAGINTGQFNATNAYNTGLQNAQMRQQAGLSNQALQGQYGLQQGQFQQAANTQNSQQGLQAALANQQMGYNTGAQNLAANLGIQQLGAGQNMQSQLANQQAFQQEQAAAEQSRQYGAGQGLQAASLSAQYGQAAQNAAEQSRQYGAGLNMQGYQTGLQAAGQMGQLGQDIYGQQMGINQLQNQYGAQQQAQAQRPMDMAYQDFLNQQNYPYKQLGYMSDMINRLPLGQKSTSQMYEAPGSTMGQLAGLGMGAYGLSQMGLKIAGGGLTKSYAEGGLADGGDVNSPQNIESILAKLSDAQLRQAHEAALNRRDVNEAQMIEAVIAQRAAMRQGSEQPHGGIAPALPEQFANGMEQSMATGGIVAFADRGIVTEGEDYSHEGLSNAAPVSVKSAANPAPVGAKTNPSTKQPAVPDSIKPAVAALAEKTGADPADLMDRLPQIMDIFQKQNAPLLEQQRAMIEQSKPDNEAMRQQGLAQALTQFGFKMAAAASRPSARFLESASVAAPEISAAAQDMNKLMAAKQENYNRLKMDQMRYENALQIGNMKDATILSGQIRQSQQADKQINMQQDQLAATIQHQTEMESQGRKGLDIQAAQAANAAANRPETIKSISDMLANATPEQRKNIENAAGLRYGVAANVRSNTALLQAQEKAREAVDKLPRFMNLSFMSTTDPKYPALKAEYDQEVRSRTQQLMPQGSDTGTGFAAPSGGATVMKFDAKGNPI